MRKRTDHQFSLAPLTIPAALLALCMSTLAQAQPCSTCSNLIPSGLQIDDCRQNEVASAPMQAVSAGGPGGGDVEIHHGNLFPGGITITHVCIRLQSPTGLPGEPGIVSIRATDPNNFNLPSGATYSENFVITPNIAGYQLVQLAIPQTQTADFWLCVEYPTAISSNGNQIVSPRTQGNSALYIDAPTLGWIYYDDTNAAPYVGFAPMIRALELGPVPPQACCLPDGSCIFLHPPLCIDQGGTPQGANTQCADITCPGPNVCQAGANNEPEACGGNINGGCNSTPPAFTPAGCGKVFCGTAWALGTNRDTDWYSIDLLDGDGDGSEELTVQLSASLPLVTYIFDDQCPIPVELASGEADAGMDAAMTVCLPAPATYHVFVATGTLSAGIFDGYPCGTTNDYVISFSCNEPCANPLPANDTCATAQHVLCNSATAGDTTNATSSGLPACAGVPYVDGEVWYHLVGTGGPVEAHLCDPATLVNHAISVYTGSCGNLQCMVASTTDGLGICGGNPFTSLSFPTIPGDDYYIAVHPTAPGNTGAFVLHVNCAPTGPPNDDCANAMVLLGPVGFVWDNCGATTDGPARPCGFTGIDDRDVWYEFIMPCDGTWLVHVGAAPVTKIVGVYDLCPAAGGTLIACDSQPPGLAVNLAVPGIAGQSYWIRVGSPGTCSNAPAFITVTCNNPCIGDCVTSATFAPPPDGVVNAADLAALLGAWGACPGCCPDSVTSATFAPPPDGVVDAADLAALLGNWGPCP